MLTLRLCHHNNVVAGFGKAYNIAVNVKATSEVATYFAEANVEFCTVTIVF